MSYKNPFRTIAIKKKILDALEPRRMEHNRRAFRAVSVNAYCELILWEFAEGRFMTTEEAARLAKSPWSGWQGETLQGIPVIRSKKEAPAEDRKESHDQPKKTRHRPA